MPVPSSRFQVPGSKFQVPGAMSCESTALECSDLSELSFSPTVYFRVSVGRFVDVIVKESGDESPHSKIYVSRITGFESPRQKITAPKHERGRFAFPVGAAKRGMNSATSRQRQVAQSGSRQDSKTGKSARPTWRTPPDYVPGIQLVPASGTFAIAAASTVSATKSSGSRWCTFDLPQARANVVTSMSKTCR